MDRSSTVTAGSASGTWPRRNARTTSLITANGLPVTTCCVRRSTASSDGGSPRAASRRSRSAALARQELGYSAGVVSGADGKVHKRLVGGRLDGVELVGQQSEGVRRSESWADVGEVEGAGPIAEAMGEQGPAGGGCGVVNHLGVETREDRLAGLRPWQGGALDAREYERAVIGIAGRQAEQGKVDVATRLEHQVLMLAEVDGPVGSVPYEAVQLVEADRPGRLAGVGAETIDQPGVEQQVELVGDGEGLGEAAQVLGTDPGLTRLPPFVVAVAGCFGSGEHRQPGVSPELLEYGSERIDGVTHRRIRTIGT